MYSTIETDTRSDAIATAATANHLLKRGRAMFPMPISNKGTAMSLVTRSMSKRMPSHNERSTHDVSLSMPVFNISGLRHRNTRRTMLKSITPTAVAHSTKRMGRGGVMVCKKLRSCMSSIVVPYVWGVFGSYSPSYPLSSRRFGLSAAATARASQRLFSTVEA